MHPSRPIRYARYREAASKGARASLERLGPSATVFPLRAARFRANTAANALCGVAARALELTVVGCGWVLLPIWPFVAAAVARDSSYVRAYARTLERMTKHIRATLRAHAIARFVDAKLSSAHREAIVGACTHCGNCCLHRSCVFLDFAASGQSRCRIYGGRIWKMLACGEYPTSRVDIALYDCPSYAAQETAHVAAGRKVIPIRLQRASRSS
jgi:hypothetical protein